MANTVSGKYRNDTGPLTTSYTSFAAYPLESIIRDELMAKEVDIMMVEGQKQTISKGSNIISEKYLAGGELFSMGGEYGDGAVLVVIQSSDGTDVVAYVVKTREEIGDEDWMEYRHAFMGEMTDEIWNTMQGWFSTTLTVTTSSGTITISDGSQSILVNASTHAMRYNVDYYDWSSNTSTEYSTLQTNGWLVDGTYTYQGVNQDWSNIIESLKTKGIVNATITHDTVNGEITMQNGQWSFTIMDKNLGATQVYQDGDTLSETNCGTYFQWGNNYGFPWIGGLAATEAQVDTTGYGPGNYYTDSTYRTRSSSPFDWSNPSNDNLRGNITDTDQARQGPAPSGYHVPSIEERRNFIKMFNAIRPNAHSGDDLKNTFAIPLAGYRGSSSASVDAQDFIGDYWSSSPYGPDEPYYAPHLYLDSSKVSANDYDKRVFGFSVRCFKNTVNA